MRNICASAGAWRRDRRARSILSDAMRTTAKSALIVALVLAAGCASPYFPVARGQTGGAGGGGGSAPEASGRFVSSMSTSGGLTVEDTTNNFAVIRPNDLGVATQTQLRATLEYHPADGGYDVVVHYTNNTSEAQELGVISVAGIRFGNKIEIGDFRHDAKFIEFDSQGRSFATAGREYPEDLYSPVGVIRDDRYTVGMSLNYPILEYEHGVRVNFHVPGGAYIQSGQCWNGEFQLRGKMEPGESRQYTLSVRVVENEKHWLTTLVPYRDYFQEMYGAVRYERDPRPVLGFFIGMNGALSANNIYGFDGQSRRPDLHGWAPWASYIATAPERGYERVMLWAASGLFRNHSDMNYPYQFMTGMDHAPLARDTADLLKERVADAGIDLGFWWGRSSQVMREWDTDQTEPMDPDNPDHVALAFRELDLAVERGASTIGLDAFVYMDGWDAYRWLEMMHDRYPHLKFVVEPSGPDFEHVLAATWVEGLHHVQTPPLLQDFLVPGHETWVNTRMDLYQSMRGVAASDAVKNHYWQELSDEGYVIMSYEVNTRMTGDWSAKEGWLRNIPQALLSDPRRWQSAGASGGLGGPSPDPDPDPGSGGASPPPPPSGGVGSGGSGSGGGGSAPGPTGGAGAGGTGAGGTGAGGTGAGGSGSGAGTPPKPSGGGGAGSPPRPSPPPPPPPRQSPPQPTASAPPRISTPAHLAQAAQQALARPRGSSGHPGAGTGGGGSNPSVGTAGSSSRGVSTTGNTSRSLSERMKDRREARRLARATDERYQRRMERRQRLVERLGLGSLSYERRRTALQTYRSEQRDIRTRTLATHPDGE